MTLHAAVFIDHHEAKIFDVDADASIGHVDAPRAHVRRHPSTTKEHDHPADAQRFYHDVVKALEGAERVLVVGPSTAKHELLKHVHEHDRAFEPKIVGIETVDHPTGGQLVAFARKYFRAADRMR